jgi:hypothetical protein
MEAKRATFQTPRPEVKIYSSDKKIKLEIDTSNNKNTLQAYSFGTSVSDERGKFSLTFYPDESDRGEPVFDIIEERDIVEIYESRNHFQQYRTAMGNLVRDVLPTFTGVVRKKKYAAQFGESGASRRLVVSGHSAAGLVSDFYINMDSSAMAVTKRYRSQENISKQFTIDVSSSGPKPRKIKEIIKIVWDKFVEIGSEDKGVLSTPAIYRIIKRLMGEDFFDIDEQLTFHYPIGCIFDGKSTKSFFDFIDTIVPAPAYERFAYMDRATGRMKIKIRECPFDPEPWQGLKYTDPGKRDKVLDCYNIPARLVKGFDIEQSDDEVYTVFFSYLDNSPISLEKALKLQAQEEPGPMTTIKKNTEKYAVYGYRPLFVHFKGYGYGEKEKTIDTSTTERLQKLNERLETWYGDLEKMYSGSLALSTDLSMDMPQAGEKIAFLGGEFYVESADHTWNFGGNPQTTLAISRGGVYSAESEFEELKYWGKKKTENGVTWTELI